MGSAGDFEIVLGDFVEAGVDFIESLRGIELVELFSEEAADIGSGSPFGFIHVFIALLEKAVVAASILNN